MFQLSKETPRITLEEFLVVRPRQKPEEYLNLRCGCGLTHCHGWVSVFNEDLDFELQRWTLPADVEGPLGAPYYYDFIDQESPDA